MTTWLPDDLPVALQGILAGRGIPAWVVRHGRLVGERGTGQSWRLELSIPLSEGEGDSMMGALWPEGPGDHFEMGQVDESESEEGGDRLEG